jgi:hypothetical protein
MHRIDYTWVSIFLRGHRWTRNATTLIPIFRNEINALSGIRGGVKVARNFTAGASPVWLKISKPCGVRTGSSIMMTACPYDPTGNASDDNGVPRA